MTKQNNFYLQQGELFVLYMSIGSQPVAGSKIVGKVDLKKLRENHLGAGVRQRSGGCKHCFHLIRVYQLHCCTQDWSIVTVYVNHLASGMPNKHFKHMKPSYTATFDVLTFNISLFRKWVGQWLQAFPIFLLLFSTF